MQVSSITCYCKGTSSSDFLKETDYEGAINKLSDFAKEAEQKVTELDNLMSTGNGLSADALNLGGFAPLFEMGYSMRQNTNQVISKCSEISSSITNDAKAHMMDEWSKYYQEISKCIDQLNKSLSGLKSPQDDNEINSINQNITNHQNELNNASSNLQTVGGDEAVSLVENGTYEDNMYSSQLHPKGKTPTSGGTNQALTQEVEDYIRNNSAGGSWSTYVKNLKTGEITNINGNSRMTAASLIKLFIMAAAYERIDNDPNVDRNTILNRMGPMITVSDNQSANDIIAALGGMDAVNSYISANGYDETSLNRLLLTARTTENYTSAEDVSNLLEKIYNNELPHSDEMLNLLKQQTRRNKIPTGLPSGVVVANKTGELDDVENDAAIIYSGGDYIEVVMSEGVNTGQAQSTISEISSIVYDEYSEDEE